MKVSGSDGTCDYISLINNSPLAEKCLIWIIDLKPFVNQNKQKSNCSWFKLQQCVTCWLSLIQNIILNWIPRGLNEWLWKKQANWVFIEPLKFTVSLLWEPHTKFGLDSRPVNILDSAYCINMPKNKLILIFCVLHFVLTFSFIVFLVCQSTLLSFVFKGAI